MIKRQNLVMAFVFASALVFAQDAAKVPQLSGPEMTNKKGSEYRFSVIKNLDATAVQNQNMTGTCWSFSALSFFESELIRMGKGKEYNLSEMFVARKAYPMKADNYVRMHGRTN